MTGGIEACCKEEGFRLRTQYIYADDDPEDVSIVGFDNLPIGNYIQPALTTVHVPKQYIGKTAVRRLKERLMDSHFVPVHILAGVRLVERSS
ncbi:MAG: substrate-binding domain-containing protein [Lachnospiraceae bacterium]|nr:substrate-binding domain-containing protein [Lachnospiraceae bacterium]